MNIARPTQADASTTTTTRKKRKLYERFLVLEVSVVEYETPGEYCVIIGNEKVCAPFSVPKALYGWLSLLTSTSLRLQVLRLFDEVHSAEKFAQLRGPWVCTEVHPGEYVHVIGQVRAHMPGAPTSHLRSSE